ncbi:hypothetical protein MWN33_10675 [Starkeya koreensis]|uniref:MxaH protein n=1 Tax=Ancylobacter koreensis TaxID=266121 RepID=A0ABT0DMK9_9HYPH|nr:hypothetical protein [Ancylobacter koreensis]MCK0208495.1 hypothetical protein [Ancylobacter koreensis]
MTIAWHPLSRALIGAAVAAAALAGCSEERSDGRAQEPRERVAAPVTDDLARRKWLSPTDDSPPDLWLASREAGRDIGAKDPAVAGWHDALADAGARFGETDRMIANRAVQLETMLREIRIEEGAKQILADFAKLAPKGARAGFSDLCQHYYNLRAQGVGRAEALERLRERAGTPASAGSGEGSP